tara:strand:+ start:388 stop:549 length:162 start_codon:yes stop_codon:yes gene_type:complete
MVPDWSELEAITQSWIGTRVIGLARATANENMQIRSAIKRLTHEIKRSLTPFI